MRRAFGVLMSVSLMLGGAAALGGCQTLSTMPSTGFSARQIAVLQREGFTRSDRGWMFDMDDRLLFATDESAIRPEQATRIGRIAAALLTVGIRHARIEGYADSTGAESYNDQLSARRAQAVADAMAHGGFATDNLAVAGLGERDPVETNATAKGRAQNRRVVILIAAGN